MTSPYRHHRLARRRAEFAGRLGLVGLLASAALAVSLGRASATTSPVTARYVPVGGLARIPGGARPGGALPTSTRLSLGIALRPRDPAALAAYATGVSMKGSASYHHYLTPRSFVARFGPSKTAISRLENELRSAHLRVGRLSSNHLILAVSGSVKAIEHAFRTSLKRYRLAGSRTGWATTSVPQLQSPAASSVAAVLGLDNLAVPHSFLRRAPLGRRAGVQKDHVVVPHVTTPGAPSACGSALQAAIAGGGWTDNEIAAAYGLSGLFAKGDLGAGQTIDVFELEPFSMTDLSTFDQCYFGASHTSSVSTVNVDGFDLTGSGSGESILDIETLSALAPDAKIVVYQAPNTTFGAIDNYNAMVSADQANIISTSWGECEQALQTGAPGAQQVENYLFEEAAAQGQTVFSAAGDTGSDDCASTQFGTTSAVAPYASVDDPASQPFVVGVGGTSLTSDVQPLGTTNEMVWNDGSQWGGGGGGYSSTWSSPAWQRSSKVTGVATSGAREVPDVSASADEWRGITVYSSGFAPTPTATGLPTVSAPPGWVTVGGTSGAAPMWAAITADIAASGPTGTSCSALSSTTGGADLGFVAPELYQVAASSYASSFHDITIGSNDVFGLGTGYTAGTGYDLASGLGSPIVTNPSGSGGLASSLCAAATASVSGAPQRPTISSISPSFGPTGGGETATISLSSSIATGSSVTVQFGSSPATVLSASASSVTVTVPASTLSANAASYAGAGPALVTVLVANSAGSSASLPGNAAVFDYVNESNSGSIVPTVTGVGPDGGNVAGGNTVTIYGSGFSAGPDTVSFGGVDSTSVKVVSNYALSVVVPPKSKATSCASGLGFEPSSDCQSEVVVANANGSSAMSTILPALSGYIVFSPQGIVDPTPETEVVPAASEYDYSPTPTITSITPNPGDATGQLPETITGSGFSLNNFEWVNFGPATSSSSEQVQLSYISSTSIVIAPPALNAVLTTGNSALSGGVSVQTSGGLSNAAPFSYAGVPIVTRLSSFGGPTNGGTALTITGEGLSAVNEVGFVSQFAPSMYGASVSTNISAKSESSLTVVTPADLPGPVDVIPCTPTTCAKANPSVDTFVYYSLGAPSLSTFSPKSGPAEGGTQVTLFGNNLNGLTAVSFGPHASRLIALASGYPDGDPYIAAVRSTPGAAGHSVHLTVHTRGGSKTLSTASFTYKKSAPSAPEGLRVSVVRGNASMRWRPPMSNGGSPVTGYTVVAFSPTAAPIVRHLPARATRAGFATLRAGNTYVFRVVATNRRHGVGLWARSTARHVGYASDGYRVVSATGKVEGFGSLPAVGNANADVRSDPVVGATGTPSGSGYWVVLRSGTVAALGGAPDDGELHPGRPVVGIVADPSGGYWVLTSVGNVFSFGGARFFGSIVSRHEKAKSPIVSMVAAPHGIGYVLVAANGATYRFGAANSRWPSQLSLGGAKVIATAGMPSGAGYFVLTSKNKVLAVGAAKHYGDPSGRFGPEVSIASSGNGMGYVVVSASGHVSTFGDARYEGSAHLEEVRAIATV